MILDNCPAHLMPELENTELFFLPPNTTSVTQLMDEGIVRNMKFHYRRLLANRRLDAAEEYHEFKLDILDCLLAVKSSWSMLKGETIANCWRKAGFVQDGECDNQVAAESDDEVETRDIFSWQKWYAIYPFLAIMSTSITKLKATIL